VFRLTDLFILFPLALIARFLWGVARPAARAPIGRVILDALFITYVVVLLEVVLGFNRLGVLGADFVLSAHINLVPLRTIGEIAQPGVAAKAIGQVVGNILLFVPLGVLLPLTVARFRTFRSVLVAGLLISAGIEVMQLALLLARLMNRSADIDDVILNTIGAVLGYSIWALLSKGTTRQAEKARAAVEGES
jgi:glycopeptide antibiotics resistance protein